MKKLMAALLTLTMILGCAGALAETAEVARVTLGAVDMNGAFELQCALPEGYTYTVIRGDGANFYVVIGNPDNDAAPTMLLSISYDEMHFDVARLNDLPDEELALIEATFAEEDEVEISYTETAHGTKLMVIKEIEGAVDYVDFYTIYQGYSIEFVLVDTSSDEGLTEEQIRQAVSFLSDLDFVPVEAE